MNRTNYAKRAARRFLFGTRCRTPAEAVERGERTLGEWAQVLAEERERAEAIARLRGQKRNGTHKHRASARTWNGKGA